MALDYYKGINTLLDDLRRSGLCPSVAKSSGGDRMLTAEIAVKGGVVIHWDRESRSVWTEGPWPDAARVEGRLRRLYHGSAFRRASRQPKVIASVLAAAAMLVASYLASDRSNLPAPETTTHSFPGSEEPRLAEGTGSR